MLNGNANEATMMFARILLEGTKPDSVTIGSDSVMHVIYVVYEIYK